MNDRLTMKSLFEYSNRARASDLLVTAGSPPMVRVDGDLVPATKTALAPEHTRSLIYSLLNETQQARFEEDRELDFSLSVSGGQRFRANIYYQKGSVAGAFRLIPDKVPDMDSLGLPPVIPELAKRPSGLILVTGPTGSGKSTTMASMIDLVNRSRRCHIITVEDPIEFVHTNKKAIVDQRELHADTLSFGNALKYVLRQDPDVILVGEMRDVETIQAALTAAETGHLVIATLHTNDAIQSIDRIVDVFPPHHHYQVRLQLSFALLCVISQQLIPRASGKGRALAAEVLVKTRAVAAHIRDGKTHQTRTTMESGRADGMIVMDHALRNLYFEGEIAFDEAARRISSSAILQELKDFRDGKKNPTGMHNGSTKK